MSAIPDNNPKTRLGIQKVPMHLVPPSAKIALATAFADGANKYGPYNWRDETVSASIYYAAAQRHIDRWWDRADEGDLAPDSLVHHIDHAMACLAIIKDGLTIGKLNDDRPPKGAAGALQDAYADKQKELNGNSNTKPSPGNPALDRNAVVQCGVPHL